MHIIKVYKLKGNYPLPLLNWHHTPLKMCNVAALFTFPVRNVATSYQDMLALFIVCVKRPCTRSIAN